MKVSYLVAALGLFISINSAAKLQETVLRLKERIPVEQLALSVLDPGSARYNKFYSPEEIRDLSGPADADYDALKATLVQDGFEIVNESKTHLVLTVQAEKATIERAFSTHLESDFNSRVGLVSVKLLSPYMIPSRLDLVEAVSGLDTTRQSRPHIIPASFEKTTLGRGPTTPDDIKKAYGITAIQKSGIKGKGQHIAIATYDDFNLSDVKGFYSSLNLKPGPAVDKVQFNGVPAVNNDSAAETETDAELSGMIAPEVQIHVFTSAHNDDPGEVELFTAILDDNRSKIANYSWGDCEAHVSAQHKADMDKVFARAVAQGVNIIAASGDTGAKGCRDKQINPDWPAAHPFVVGVGGTTFNLKGGKLAETGWSGSGGGVSTFYDLPAWQAGFQSPYVKRSFPDVAFNADPQTGENVWVHYPTDSPQWVQIGGTSIAAPQWAGLLALINQGRTSKGPLGFINPLLYGMTSNEHKTLFDDVTKGDNQGYTAGAGWDAITGWGGPHGDLLLKYFKNK